MGLVRWESDRGGTSRGQGPALAFTTQRRFPANDELVLIIVIESQEKERKFATLKR